MSTRPFDLVLLQSFLRVVETGSVSAASESLYRSQSAVSEQLQKLEEFCGTTLLSRGRVGMAPTPAGERLLAHARVLLERAQAAYEDLRGIEIAGEVHLAITDYFRPGAIALLLKALGDQYPRLRTHVSIVKSAVIEREAGVGEFDLGVSMTIAGHRHPTGPGRYARRRLRDEALVWVAAESFRAEAGQPLALVALPETCSLQARVRHQLVRGKRPHYVAHTASGVGGVQSAVMAGLGVACLNQSAVPAGARVLRAGTWGLPAMPSARFSLLVSEGGRFGDDDPLVERIAERLA